MISSQIGDLYRFSRSAQQTNLIKSDLFRLATELSSGKKSDLARSLGMNAETAKAHRHQIDRIDSYLQNSRIADTRLSTIQASLDRIAQIQSSQNSRLALNIDTLDDTQVSIVASASKTGFADAVSALFARAGNVAVFSGTKTDQASVPPAHEILDNLKATLALPASATSLASQVEAYFESGTGGFETQDYRGGPISTSGFAIAEGKQITTPVSALSPAIRQTLTGLALASIASDDTITPEIADKKAILTAARNKLADTAPLTALQSSIGAIQERVSETSAQQTAQRTALSMHLNTLTQADPFETAGRLQEVQLQLETHFTVSSRLSRLSLVNYLP